MIGGNIIPMSLTLIKTRATWSLALTWTHLQTAHDISCGQIAQWIQQSVDPVERYSQLGNEIADAAAWQPNQWSTTITNLRKKVNARYQANKDEWGRIYNDLYTIGTTYANDRRSTPSEEISCHDVEKPELLNTLEGEPLQCDVQEFEQRFGSQVFTRSVWGHL